MWILVVLTSEANVTEIHEGLHLDEMEGEGNEDSQGHFGIFSICWANNGQEIAAGTGSHSVLVYNLERAKVPSPHSKAEVVLPLAEGSLISMHAVVVSLLLKDLGAYIFPHTALCVD